MTTYSRADWGAASPKSITLFSDAQPTSLTVHAVGGNVGIQDNYLDDVKAIQNHAFGKGLSDIDYNFLVDFRGNIYEGRGARRQSGAQHVGNSVSLAVCYLDYGDGDVPFTPEAKGAILALRSVYVRGGVDAPIHPHRFWNNGGQFDTACPGDEIAAWCEGKTYSGSGGPVTPQEIQAVADAVNSTVGNRVIATLQTNMKNEWIPQIIAGVAAKLPAGSVDVTTMADKVADEFSKRLAINV